MPPGRPRSATPAGPPASWSCWWTESERQHGLDRLARAHVPHRLLDVRERIGTDQAVQREPPVPDQLHQGLSAAQLARDSFVTAQSMADLVRSPEGRGHVRRERNPRNRRELLILLTDAGRELLGRFAGPVRELEERMVRELTAHQEDQFRQALSKAWHALS